MVEPKGAVGMRSAQQWQEIQPPQPPEGRMLEEGLRTRGWSVRAAAQRSGISESRWRQVIRGSQTRKNGTYLPVSAPPVTVARMALALDLAPHCLREAARPDAARVLQYLLEHGDTREDEVAKIVGDRALVQLILRELPMHTLLDELARRAKILDGDDKDEWSRR